MMPTEEQVAQERRATTQADEIVSRVINAGFSSVLGEIREKYALSPPDVFMSNKRPAPIARGFLYVRMQEKSWSPGRIASVVRRDVSSVKDAIRRYHLGVIAGVSRLERGHWLGKMGPYVDGLLDASSTPQSEGGIDQ